MVAAAAHRTLEELGLLEVRMIDRHQDGRAVDFRGEGALLHRLRVRHEGFEEDAYNTTVDTFRRLKSARPRPALRAPQGRACPFRPASKVHDIAQVGGAVAGTLCRRPGRAPHAARPGV